MRISAISCVPKLNYKHNISKQNQTKNYQMIFNGLKGEGIGVLWGGLIVGICAIGAPYLVPADAIIDGAGAGALTGHAIEKGNKKDNNK